MAVRWERKRPNEVRDYRHDWTLFLDGDTIATSDVTVTADTVTIDSDTNDTTSVTVWISGGDEGDDATITNTITTAAGRTETEIFRLLVTDAEEPVTLNEAKAQCRMADDDSEDAYIACLIPPARAYVERVGRYQLVPTTRSESFNRWGDYLEIYRRPVLTIDEIIYTDEAGDAGTEYEGFLADVGRFPLRIYPGVDDEFPATADGGSITVTYTTGAISDRSEEYLIARRAILLLVGHWFEFRETAQAGIISDEIAFAISSMLDELRPVSVY